MVKGFFQGTICVLCMMISSVWHPLYGQEDTVDPSGYIAKYDRDFDGIGPKVYILPAPRTKKEMLTDTYQEITSFRDSIRIALKHQKFVDNLKITSNNAIILDVLNPEPTTDADWETLIKKNKDQNHLALAYGLLNEYARRLTYAGKVDQAISKLEQAVQYASMGHNPVDMNTIQANLSTLQFLNINANNARNREADYYEMARKNENKIDQGQSLVRLAYIQSLYKNYVSAENTIIRKAIPLFNKSRFYEGKIWAWEILAEIYQAQNKHIEAQWFLIQARDLARAKDQENDLAEIEYMLAYSKYIQKNFDVARDEFIRAYKLAEKEKNDLLKLAIVEKLGNIYLRQDNIDSADTLLKEYWQLRTTLFGS